MTDAPDVRLLEQFAQNGSEDAFAALVQRHISLVHSVALRHTANPQHAEDITQAVFIILARKAGSLGVKTRAEFELHRRTANLDELFDGRVNRHSPVMGIPVVGGLGVDREGGVRLQRVG